VDSGLPGGDLEGEATRGGLGVIEMPTVVTKGDPEGAGERLREPRVEAGEEWGE
jgi:hypothetical protein